MKPIVALSLFGIACGGRSELPPGSAGSAIAGSSPVAQAGATAAATAGASAGGSAANAGGADGSAGVNAGGSAGEPELAPQCAALQVVGDANHTCALTAAHSVRCWGDNVFGQLGDGTGSSRSLPGPELLTNVRALAAGGGLTCAVTLAGGLSCWGQTQGLLGKSSTELPVAPRPVEVLDGVADVVVAAAAACALSQTGGVRCWGQPFDGISTLDAHSPPATDALLDVRSLAASEDSSSVCVVTNGAKLRCWFSAAAGVIQLPTFDLLDSVESVALGGRTCAVTEDHRLRCWWGIDLRTGHAMFLEGGAGPFNIDSLTNVAAVSVHADGGCLLTTRGGVRCWGNNEAGQLGDGTGVSRTDVVGQDVVSDARSVVAVNERRYAITSAGRLYGWGTGQRGALGDGNVTSLQNTPRRIALCP